jgi:hypothetical protein
MTRKPSKPSTNNQHQDVRVKIDVDTAPVVSTSSAFQEKPSISKDNALKVEIVKGVVAVLVVFLPLIGTLYVSGAFTPKPAATPTPVALTATTTPMALTNTPTPFPISEITSVTPLQTATALVCPWIPFLDGKAAPELSGEKCLSDLKGIGISGNEKQISFFVKKSPLGIYGICQDVSEKERLEFHVSVQNNIDSARFLVTLGPVPIPNKLSYAMRMQPEIQPKQEKEMYVKFIQYTLEGYDKDINQIKAIPDWKHLNNWGFDFIFQFSGPKVTASMNKALQEEWQLAPPNRYLCFAYQAMPTTTQSAQLEVQVNFP